MVLKLHTFGQLDIEDINIQATGSGDLWIQLPQRACSSIPGIGKEGLPFRLLALIQSMKATLGHEHLAPDDQPLGRTYKGHGDGTDGLQVLRYILTGDAIATGSTPDENTIFVFQRHGKAIHLRLYGETGIGVTFQGLFQELSQLLLGKHILQAHESHRMGILFELTQRLATHPLGGRIRTGQVRMGLFQVLQFPKQAVIFKVRHLRIIQDIVTIIGII